MLINCTPHPIGLINRMDRRIVLPPARKSAMHPVPTPRVDVDIGPVITQDRGIPIHGRAKVLGINLPPVRPGVTYIVSQITAMVAAALHPERTDLVYPATSEQDGAEQSAQKKLFVRKLVRA